MALRTILKDLIKGGVAELFSDLLFSDSEPSVVNIRWMDPTPPPGQDLVLHFVEDVPSSYISQQMPGKAHWVDGGGFTRSSGGATGSEFYKLPVINGRPTHLTARGYAKLAVHEAMHNMTGLGNAQLHGRGGLADSRHSPK